MASVQHLAKTLRQESRLAYVAVWLMQQNMEECLAKALHCAELLKRAKAEFRPTEFSAWVESQCGFSRDLAEAYLKFCDDGINKTALLELLQAMLASKCEELNLQ